LREASAQIRIDEPLRRRTAPHVMREDVDVIVVLGTNAAVTRVMFVPWNGAVSATTCTTRVFAATRSNVTRFVSAADRPGREHCGRPGGENASGNDDGQNEPASRARLAVHVQHVVLSIARFVAKGEQVLNTPRRCRSERILRAMAPRAPLLL